MHFYPPKYYASYIRNITKYLIHYQKNEYVKEFVIHKRVFCLLSDKISVISALFRWVLAIAILSTEWW